MISKGKRSEGSKNIYSFIYKHVKILNYSMMCTYWNTFFHDDELVNHDPSNVTQYHSILGSKEKFIKHDAGCIIIKIM